MNFDINRIYCINISEAKYANLPSAKIEKILVDGRHISPFQEALIELHFDNLSYVSGNKSWDYKYTDGYCKPIEMRGIPSKSGKANLIPSNMIGAGRKYDAQKYMEKLENISGYMFVCPIKNYRNLLIFGMKSSSIVGISGPLKSIDRKYINTIIGKPLDDMEPLISKIAIKENVMYDITYEINKE
jgi:hypothetical protein